MVDCEHIYPPLGQPQVCARCGYVRPQAEVDALMEAAGILPIAREDGRERPFEPADLAPAEAVQQDPAMMIVE